jgi:hypothetical protein
MEFEFGETRESEAFFDRNPKFIATFEKLVGLANKCFSQRPRPTNQVETVCFGLGYACRQDFVEVIFLAVNGYGGGSSKIIRGLYERAVTLAYIVNNPDKAERFIRYAAIQEHRLLESALKVVTEKEFDDLVGAPNTAAEIRNRYKQVKNEFQIADCKTCGTTRVQPTWDLDVAAMVHKLGGAFQGFYLPNYAIPNLAIHATLASADSPLREGTEEAHREADLQVLCGCHLLVLVMRSQNELFSLKLEAEINACEQDVLGLRSRVMGETAPSSFLHPSGVGNCFVVDEEGGPCDDVLKWLWEKADVANQFAQVLQYFKDGVVHIDYSVPHFQPNWVNEIRKFGIFFSGNPRRLPYEGGVHFYELGDGELRSLASWVEGYQSPPVRGRLQDQQNKLRKANLGAGHYYELNHTQQQATDRLVNLAIAIETLFTPQDSRDLTFRIAQYVAQLVGETFEERQEIFVSIKEMYRRRSDLFHGRYNVDKFNRGEFVTHEECNKWASIVRRGILRFLVLYLRGENDRDAILGYLESAALSETMGDGLRRRSDVMSLLNEVRQNGFTALPTT